MKEIIQASCLHGMLHFRLPPLSASALNHKCRLSGALPSLALSISEPNIACRNCRTTAICNSSLLDDAASDSAPTVVPQVDPSLPVKNRAAEISPGLKGTSVFLVGINSSMKSNLGKVLADTLRYYYFDSDTLVEEAAGGKSSAKLLIEMDEKGFRDSEHMIDQTIESNHRLRS